jgi:hypothetical protein
MFSTLNKIFGFNKATTEPEEVVVEQEVTKASKEKELFIAQEDFVAILKERIFNGYGRRLETVSFSEGSTQHISFTYDFFPANLCLVSAGTVELFGEKLTTIESKLLPLTLSSLDAVEKEFALKVESIKQRPKKKS